VCSRFCVTCDDPTVTDTTPDAAASDRPELGIDELLTTTRSVRKRLDLTRTVSLDLVKECLEIAIQAPTGSNSQTWHFVVISDPDLREKIGGYYRHSVERYLAAGRRAGDRYPDDPERSATLARIGDSTEWLADHMGQVPVLVLACIAADLPAGNQAGVWGSLLPAVWNYMLAARSRGLGTCWTTLHLRYEREIADLLGLPDGVHQGVLIPTAYYTGSTFKPAKRQPLDEVLHLNRW